MRRRSRKIQLPAPVDQPVSPRQQAALKREKMLHYFTTPTEIGLDDTDPDFTVEIWHCLHVISTSLTISIFSVGIDLKELGGQMSKCLKFCQGLKL